MPNLALFRKVSGGNQVAAVTTLDDDEDERIAPVRIPPCWRPDLEGGREQVSGALNFSGHGSVASRFHRRN